MRIRNILLVSLFVPLYGCQPEAPAPKTTAPAAMEPLPAAPAEPAAPPAASAPAQAMEPAPAEKAMQPAPASTAPAAAEARPEAMSEPAVSEADAMQLAKKSNCLNCHAVDKKLVGPSFRDVAAKYRGDAGAEARMMEKIAKGGSGVWGPMMMPPSPQVSETDRRILAKYILSLR